MRSTRDLKPVGSMLRNLFGSYVQSDLLLLDDYYSSSIVATQNLPISGTRDASEEKHGKSGNEIVEGGCGISSVSPKKKINFFAFLG